MLPESEADVSQNLEPASDASVAAQSGLLACSSSDSSGSGARLLAIRSDEARVWSSWLTKVAERVDDEWQEWLAAHINLTRRLNACLLGARDECRKRERTQLLRQAQPEEPPDLPCDYTADLEMGPCKVSRSTTTGILRDACSDKAGTASERGRSRATHLGNADDSFNNDVAAENEEEWEDEEEEDGRVADECGENKAVHEARTRTLTNEREADDGGADESCSESDGQRQEQGGCSQSSTSGSVFSSEPSNDERLIPLPRNKAELLEIIEEFKYRAKKYRALYKYWLDLSNQVNDEIVVKPWMCLEWLQSHENTPRFVYLQEADSDIESVSDDEEIQPTDEGLERITCKDLCLFFNLTDEADECLCSTPVSTTPVQPVKPEKPAMPAMKAK